MLSSEKMQWFAMRATYRRGMQIKVWGIERSGFFSGREKWVKSFENQRV